MDWGWHEIIQVLQNDLQEKVSFDEYFRRDLMLAPTTPTTDADDCKELGRLVSEMVSDGSAGEQLDRIYREGPLLIQETEEDLEGKNIDKNQRLEQIQEFALFLDQCGGCKARWHGQEG